MSDAPFFAGLDVGGGTMKAGVVDDQGGPLSSVSLPTEAARGQDSGLARMCETIRLAIAEAKLRPEQIAAIGVATPGTMDIPAGVILDPPNLRPWQNVPVRSYVHGVFGVPTAFQNDANAAAFGEYWVGAGKNAHSMVLYTLGTGVGGGIVIGGRLLDGEHSHGAEIGHLIIEMTNPRRCPCGRLGCLEAYTSAPSVVKRACEALAEDGGSSTLHRVLREKGNLTAKDIFDAAARDRLAAKIVEDTAYYLAVGAVNMMHTIDPDRVVYAGGMIAAGEGFLERIRHHVRQMAFPVLAERTVICYALLGLDAGWIGAAGCGRQLFNDPQTTQI
jgi:glucokinase